MWHVPGNKHTAADGLFQQSRIEDEMKNEENINDFIDLQLNTVQVSVSELENKDSCVLESEYSVRHQQIVYYLISLRKPSAIYKLEFSKFKKTALRYLVQDSHLFHHQS